MVVIVKLIFARNAGNLGIGQSRPSLSWRFKSEGDKDWIQTEYELSFERSHGQTTYAVKSSDSAHVPWPTDEPDLKPRERIKVGVRAKGAEWTPWFHEEVEAGLLDSNWSAKVIGPNIAPPRNLAKRPFYASTTFTIGSVGPARLYATALGVYKIFINGKEIGDHVQAPGWQSYNHRLHYQTYDVPDDVFVKGENTIRALVGEGWYAGRLTWKNGVRNIWGKEPGVMAQLEIGGKLVIATGSDWTWTYGPLVSAELYDGETYDIDQEYTPPQPVKTLSLPPTTSLIAPEAPPIRRIETVAPKSLTVSPSGKKIIDFGQNLVGWVRIRQLPARSSPNEDVTLRYAEVLSEGEMGIRPLRSAKATDTIFLGDQPLDDWEPAFTTHGFRYCEITGPASLVDDWKEQVTAVVVHSDMERLGDFDCSHALINQLHKNVVWGLRGNFVGLPTDCPQRDERLGWTGDLQVFIGTASYLYDTSGMIANWLHDLAEEQIKDSDGIVPVVIPNTLGSLIHAQAIWGDVSILAPRDLYQAYGSTQILEEQWESMVAWFEKGINRGSNGLWSNERNGFQLADWLDPKAPPEDPASGQTDQFLVADAYLVGVAKVLGEMGSILGKPQAEDYKKQHDELRRTFQSEYLTPNGRLSSDSQTAYSLAFQFNLLDKEHLAGASERIIRLAMKNQFRIGTGFAGTPAILNALVAAGHIQVAYRMLQEKGCPSWLYPLTMGATTIWERWDSILPNGEINPGEMTSFNHYALGAVASFMHKIIAGLAALDPGYRRISIRPQPGGTITSASTHTITPYGRAAVSWRLDGENLVVDFEIPPNSTAVVSLSNKEETVGSGKYQRTVKYTAPGYWPPEPFRTQYADVGTSDTLAL